VTNQGQPPSKLFDPCDSIVDSDVYESAVRHLRRANVVLPTFAQLADPSRIPASIVSALRDVDPDAPHPLNLFRIHWFNDASRRARVEVPEHVVLPRSLTGVDAPILVLLGDRFPMIHAHKVLAAYACLVPRLVTGRFDPVVQKALWPSTGNYCRGGVAVSRILGCRGVAILPEGMSAERFHWLDRWVTSPDDVVRTGGSESNVKEIYDRCEELARDPQNHVFNQFAEMPNHLAHRVCTGQAIEAAFEAERRARGDLRLAAFVSATGSAGTIAAGDYLGDRHGTKTVAVEPVECPTMLYNGFGAHNIQGIGDKHVPLIHNVMRTSAVTAVSDFATDGLSLLFAEPAGHAYLAKRAGVPEDVVAKLRSFGLSSICNVLGAVKTAKTFGFGPDDVIATIATDGAELYESERARVAAERHGGSFDEAAAAEVHARFLLGAGTDHFEELRHVDRQRIFNLGYFTWVEQQHIPISDFEARRDQAFWRSLLDRIPVWDTLIEAMNRRVAEG
jgi:cysteine synthase